MVQPNLSELIDDHQGPAERRLVDQVVQDRRLAAAQKPGQDGNRYSIRLLAIRLGVHEYRL